MPNKQSLKDTLKPYTPLIVIKIYHFLKRLFSRIHAFFVYPINALSALTVSGKFLPSITEKSSPEHRLHGYSYSLLPNRYMEEVAKNSLNLEQAIEKSGLSIGYPAWNLLYYTLLCSLPEKDEKKACELVIVETGTNLGFSTIVLAQALKDSGRTGYVYTVDINSKRVEIAKQNVENAGLTKYVKFHVEDSLLFLKNLTRKTDYINFAFLDGNHESKYVRKEFSIIYPKIVACRGKAYFDNTIDGGVAEGLYFIKHAYSGNLLEFRNCSSNPPGNAIWQPKW